MEALKKEALVVWGLCFTSWCGGGAMAYILTKRHYKAKYEQLAAQEVAEAKVFYSQMQKPGSPMEAAEKLIERVEREMAPVSITPPEAEAAVRALHTYAGEAETEPVTHNIFADDPDWNQEVEQSKRDANPDEPYIIHVEEYNLNEPEHEQISLTYFAEDDVLSDEKGEMVPDADSLVGEDNLDRFGYGSRDNNIVYVRNDRLELDFEIAHSSGSFAKEVMGFIEHADRPGRGGIRKFRDRE